MEEGVFGVADVDEGGLEAGVEVLDAAFVDAANHAVVGLALDLELFETAVDEERDAFLEGLGVDDELPVGALFFLENREDFLEEGTLLGALVRAGFQLVRADGSGIGGRRRVDEFGVIFLGNVLRDVGIGLRGIAHVGCRVF